jgi:hypothetical protein
VRKADLANARAVHAEAMRRAAAQLGRARAGAELTAAHGCRDLRLVQHAKEPEGVKERWRDERGKRSKGWEKGCTKEREPPHNHAFDNQMAFSYATSSTR